MPIPESLTRAARRLRGAWRTFAQTGLAIGGSWTLASAAVLGPTAPFFAPIASVIVLNSPAQRGRRAAEIVIGVAAGIAVADLLVFALGVGWWQLVLIAVLAMAVVTAAGGGPLVVTQATVAAILVVTIQPPTVDLVPYRFFHAVIGGSTALLVTALLPAAPDRQLSRASRPVFDALVGALVAVAEALRDDDLAEAEHALATARQLDEEVSELRHWVAVGTETARWAPLRRAQRGLVDQYAEAVDQLDLAVRNTRVLARATIAAMRHPAPGGAPPQLADAVLDLADAVRSLADQLTDDGPSDPIRTHAGAAAARTRVLYADSYALAISRVVGQIRSTGIDLLRASGLELDDAQRALYEAPDPGPR
jgi:uncharacterized membrane protein YgaE (UPF0421/DUF939 family)